MALFGASMVFMGAPFAFSYCLVVARRQAGQTAAKVALVLSGLQVTPVAVLVAFLLPVLLGLR